VEGDAGMSARAARLFWSLFGLCLLASLLPLAMTPYPPFTDLHGYTGLIGALDRAGDPEARIHDYWVFHRGAFPNVIYLAVGWLLSRFMPVTAASSVYVALFCVAALPLALLYALRSFGKSPWLVFFAFPAIYHRCLWFGFLGSVPAVPLMLVMLGLANQTFARPRAGWRDGALAAVLFVLATAHAFLYLCAAGLLVAWAGLARGLPSPPWRRLVVLLPSLAYIAPWLGGALVRPGGGGAAKQGMVQHLISRRPPLRTYAAGLHDWFLNGYRGHVDDVVAAVFAVTLAAFLALGARASSSLPKEAATPSLWRWRLPLSAVLCALGYLLLPMSIMKPFYWWAVNVRFLVPLILTLVLLVPWRASRRALPPWAIAPVIAAGIAYGGYLTYDFRTWWMGVELAGFSEAIRAIPAGRRVHALYPDLGSERHYSHFPMSDIVDYYVVERGGIATPVVDGHTNDIWVAPRSQPPRPPWGVASAFRWAAHGPHWDYFLVKQPAPGNGASIDPFRNAPPGAVSQVATRGLWSVWKRTASEDARQP